MTPEERAEKILDMKSVQVWDGYYEGVKKRFAAEIRAAVEEAHRDGYLGSLLVMNKAKDVAFDEAAKIAEGRDCGELLCPHSECVAALDIAGAIRALKTKSPGIPGKAEAGE